MRHEDICRMNSVADMPVDASFAFRTAYADPRQTNDALLAAVAALSDLLLAEEASYICGASLYRRTERRINYRSGYYTRHLRLRMGTVPVRVPHLRYIHVRPSLCKRIKRMEPLLINTLGGCLCFGANPAPIRELIKELWTVDLPPALLAGLTTRMVAHLEDLRARSQGRAHMSRPISALQPFSPSALSSPPASYAVY